MKWIPFDKTGKVPKERRYVLLQIKEKATEVGGLPPSVCVGYLRRWSSGSFFVIPGVGGEVTHWSDCLGDDFEAPLWKGKQK